MLQLIQEPTSEVGMEIRIPDIISKIQDDYQKKYDYSRFEAQLNVIVFFDGLELLNLQKKNYPSNNKKYPTNGCNHPQRFYTCYSENI